MKEVLKSGELWDNLTTDEIINHKDFVSLKAFKGFFEETPTYFEVRCEATKKSHDGRFLTMFNQEIPQRDYVFYKQKPKV